MTTLRFVFHDDMLGKSVCGSALREKKGINTKERTNLCVRNTSTGSPYNNPLLCTTCRKRGEKWRTQRLLF
nr:MAG TPA: hypothetical protein [Caudoviricetes sp.]